MARIRVEPSQLRSLSSRFRGEIYRLESVQQRLNWAISTLDWDTRYRYGISNSWSVGRSRLAGIRGQGHSLADTLLRAAGRFESADNAPIPGMDRVFYRDRIELPLMYALPSQRLREVLGLDEQGRNRFLSCILPGVTTPLLTIGLVGLADRFYRDQASRNHMVKLCLEAINRLKPGLKSLPFVSAVIGTFLDFVEKGDYSRRGFQIAAGKNAVELAISANPIGAGVLVGSSAVQLGGSALLWGPTRMTQAYSISPMGDAMLESSAFRTEAALKKLDVGNITGDLGKLINDGFVEPRMQASQAFRDNPSLGSFSRMMGPSMFGPPGALGQALFNQQSRSLIWQDTRSLLGHAGDFSVGSYQVPLEFLRHSTVGLAVSGSEYAGQVLPSGFAGQVQSGCNSFLGRLNSLPAVPSFVGD